MAAAEAPLRTFSYARESVPPAQFEASLDGVETALAWDLADDPLLEFRALLLRALGRHAQAEAALYVARGAREHLSFDEANLALALYCMDPGRQKFAEAEVLLQHVLAVNPRNPVAPVLLERLRSMPE